MSLLVGLKVRELVWLHSRLEDLRFVIQDQPMSAAAATAKVLALQAWVERVVRDAATIEGYIPPGDDASATEEDHREG